MLLTDVGAFRSTDRTIPVPTIARTPATIAPAMAINQPSDQSRKKVRISATRPMISKGIICPTISTVNLRLTPIIKNARTNYRYAKALNHFVTIRHSQIIPNRCTISALCSSYAEEHDGASHSS